MKKLRRGDASASGRTVVDGLEKFKRRGQFESRVAQFTCCPPHVGSCTHPVSLLAAPFCVGRLIVHALEPFGFMGVGGTDALKDSDQEFGDGNLTAADYLSSPPARK